jgi:PAS domain S-box-containing protein
VFAVICTTFFIIQNNKLLKEIDNKKDEYIKNLKKKEKKIELMQKAINSHLTLTVTDLKGNIIDVNEKYCEISKFTRDELIGKNQRIFNSGYHPTKFFKAMWENLLSGNSWRSEIRNKSKNGNYFWIDVINIPIFNENGKIIKFFSISNEITERKIKELQLEESLLFNIGVLNSLTSHIAVTDQYGNILVVNDNWINFGKENGLSNLKSISIGTNYFDVCKKSSNEGDEISKEILEGISNILSNKAINFQLEYPCHSSDMERWFLLRITFFNTNNKINLVFSHLDITQRKKSEILLEKNNNELKKLNFEMDNFVYSISHDLRSPILSILGLVEMCEEIDIDNYELKSLHKMIRSGVERTDNIIKKIFEFSKNSRSEIVYEIISIREVIHELVDNLTFKGKINISIEEKCLFVFDKIRLTCLLNNILDNAIKFFRESEENHYVNISFISQHNESILTIEDNGEGISEDKIEDIFKMFYRASSKSTGAGLGLYICKEIVTRMNATITVKSQFGKGSSFTIYFPNIS